MKKLNFFLTAMILFVSTSIFAQSDKFNYQAAIRDASGEIMQNESVTIAFSIKSGSASGTEVYAETHSATTNDQGLVNLTIGSGTATSGTFSTIDWSANNHFLNVKIDGTDMGTSEFQSVPYANYAETAGNVFSGDYNDLTNKPVNIAGRFAVGTNTTIDTVVTINFPMMLSNDPIVLATVQGCCSFPDAFSVTIVEVQPTFFKALIRRLDGVSDWGQDLQLNWFVWSL